ncbi:MAG: NYN domain-containing protein [Desulfobacterota bacterium]|nr:NYN domain-containing protein [Thermodesulfobacteriota bacterium]
MLLLIDGYNLLHSGRPSTPFSSSRLQMERDRLLETLSRYRQIRSLDILVVFDGWQGGWPTERKERRKGVEVLFSKAGERADEVIKRIIQEKGSGVVVVSSDREIGSFANRRSVAVVSSEAFRERLSAIDSGGEERLAEETEERERPGRRLSKRERRTRMALKRL